MSEVKTPLEVAHERLAQYIAERDEQKRLLEISRAIEAEQCDEIARLKRVIVILNGQLDVTQKELAERDRELEAVKRDLADSSAQIVLDNDTVQALRSQLEATKEEANNWKSVAQTVGELLSPVGPDNYYSFTPGQWREWAREAVLSRLGTLQALKNLTPKTEKP